MSMEYWVCIVGPTEREELPRGSDFPMRQAVCRTFESLTGLDAYNCSSGWGNSEEDARRIQKAWTNSTQHTSMDVGNHKTAEKMGMAMMIVPMGILPQIARDFAEKLCSEVGFCGETLLTAWTVYAQCVLGLPCTDDLYKARPQDVEWFQNQLEKV